MNTNSLDITQRLLDALLAGNRREASSICQSYIKEGNSIKNLYETIIKPALYQVGLLWEENKITVATEHMATAITEGILNELYPQLIPDNYNNKKVVLACDQNEEHQVGIKMVADMFEMKGWDSSFLGSKVPLHELIHFIEENKPQQIALSLSVFYNFKSFKEMTLALRQTFPEIPVLVGGQAFRHLNFEEAFEDIPNIVHIPDLNTLENYIDHL